MITVGLPRDFEVLNVFYCLEHCRWGTEKDADSHVGPLNQRGSFPSRVNKLQGCACEHAAHAHGPFMALSLVRSPQGTEVITFRTWISRIKV